MLKIFLRSTNRSLVGIAVFAAVIVACPSIRSQTTSPSAQVKLRLYIPDATVSRTQHSIPLVVESNVVEGDGFQRVGISTQRHSDFERALANRTKQEKSEHVKTVLVITYENLGTESRSFLIQTQVPIRLIDIARGETLTKTFIEGPPLMPGSVRFRAFLVHDLSVIASSPEILVSCVD